jgi:hypothetical protein
VRYPEGGGLIAERRAFREGVRLQAGERFEVGEKTAVIAKELRVSVRSVERWRGAWREGGMNALRSAGPANSATVTDARSPCWRRNSAGTLSARLRRRTLDFGPGADSDPPTAAAESVGGDGGGC